MFDNQRAGSDPRPIPTSGNIDTMTKKVNAVDRASWTR